MGYSRDATWDINSGTDNVTSLTIVNVTTSNSDRLLLAFCAIASSSTSCTSVARSAETFTEHITVNPATLLNGSLWRYTNPATSATDIVFTFTGSARRASAIAISLSGIDQTTPVGTEQTNDDSAVTSISYSAVSGGVVTYDFLTTTGETTAGTTVPTGGQTKIVDNESSADYSTRSDSYAGEEVGASNAGSWGWTTAASAVVIAVPINEVAASANNIVRMII